MKRLLLILAVFVLSVTYVNAQQSFPHRAVTDGYTQAMTNAGNNVQKGMSQHIDGVPFLAIQAGASLQFGEFGRIRANFPGMSGFTLLGGIGKEWIFNHDYNNKTLWHAGGGYYFSDGPDFVGNLEILAVNSPSISDIGILLNGELNFFFDKPKRLGAFVGFGVGFGELDRDNPKTLWEFSIGVTYKIFRN